MKSLLRLFHNVAGLKVNDDERTEDSPERRSEEDAEAESWPESRLRGFRETIESDSLSMHVFPFPDFLQYHTQHQSAHPNWMTSDLWSFGVAYRTPESEIDPGPVGWYGYALEFGGSHLPENWVRISSQFGEKVHPSQKIIGTEATSTFGKHLVGPHPDPTAALIVIMKYVNRLSIEKESEYLSATRSINESTPGSKE